MPQELLSPYRYQKPPAGSTIDYTQEISSGLVSYWSMSEGGGLSTLENHRKAEGVFSGSVLPVWSNGQISFDGTKALLSTPSPFVPPPFTIVVKCTPTSLQNGANGRAIWSHDDATNIGYRINYETGTHTLAFTFGGVADYPFTNLLPAVNVPAFMAVTVDKNGGSAVGYLSQGMSPSLQQQTVAIGTIAAGTPNRSTFSTPLFADIIHFAGLFEYAAHFNRVLNYTEIQNLANEPYSLLRGPDSWRRLGFSNLQVAGTYRSLLPLLGVG